IRSLGCDRLSVVQQMSEVSAVAEIPFLVPKIREKSAVAELGYRPALDIIRFASAMWVMLSHTGACKGGGHAVSIFFVLSGYLIGGQLIEEKLRTGAIQKSVFYFKRVTRIWLPY